MSDTKKVKINGKQVEIKKIPIRKTAELMQVINKGLPKIMEFFNQDEMDEMTEEVFLSKLPILIANVQDEIFELAAVVTGIEQAVIEELSLEEFMTLATDVVELNNFKAIINQAKNLVGAIQRKKK
jgi:hypothetical protein